MRQTRHALCPCKAAAWPAPFGLDGAQYRRDDHESQRHQQAGHDPGHEELRHRCLRQEPVDDQVDRRRQQDAQRATGGNCPGKEALIIALLAGLRHRDRGDSRGRGDRRSRRGRKHRGRTDIGMDKPARQPGKPGIQRGIGTLRDTCADEDFAQQHEQRYRDQQETVG